METSHAMPFSLSSPYQAALPGDRSGNLASRPTPGVAWASAAPTPVKAPRALAVSPHVAALLGVDLSSLGSQEVLEMLSGNRVWPGSEPFAMAYGGHQFGGWAGQLGDGRAIVLGTHTSARGDRHELQLKGAGRTAYSRRGDGRAVLRSSLREFACSEAMHFLGVPTTRALSLVLTGDQVMRDMFYDGNAAYEPGAIVCRVAPSFVRFGHFELPRAVGDVELLRTLVDHVIDTHYPAIASRYAGEEKICAFFHEVAERTARLVVHWMRVGFVHGVLNTDNMSILGLTLDYGPYGFVEDFDAAFTPNTTDRESRRYCYGAQPHIGSWNVERLAVALQPLVTSPKPLLEGIDRFANVYDAEAMRMLASKFGFDEHRGDGDTALVSEAFDWLKRLELDFTIFFRRLASLDEKAPSVEAVEAAAYKPDLLHAEREGFAAWLERYAARLRENREDRTAVRATMNATNPRIVFRNYLAQEAIDDVMQGRTAKLDALMHALERPYDDGPAQAAFDALRPEWARVRAGCSMLSCSS